MIPSVERLEEAAREYVERMKLPEHATLAWHAGYHDGYIDGLRAAEELRQHLEARATAEAMMEAES